jgi:hypothetical protein
MTSIEKNDDFLPLTNSPRRSRTRSRSPPPKYNNYNNYNKSKKIILKKKKTIITIHTIKEDTHHQEVKI